MMNGPWSNGSPLVLVVDDYQDAREMYADYFELSGFRVAQASNGEEALERARTLRPDVVLMDMSLPVMDGWEATRRMREDERMRHIPVVALSGHALTKAAGEAQGLRCDAYVIKPCLPEALLKEVRRVLARRAGAASEQVTSQR